MSTPHEIKDLQQKRTLIVKQLLNFRLMIPGSFKEVYRKCGKQNCWCRDKAAGHLLRRITWSENGHSKTRAIPEKDIDWIQKATGNYREFRKKRKEIQKLDKSIKGLLDAYEKDTIKKSRQLRDYL